MNKIEFLTADERKVLAEYHATKARSAASVEDYQGALNHSTRQKLFEEKDLATISTKELGLRTRTINCLTADGIQSVAELVSRTEKEVLKCPNLGPKSLQDVIEALAEKGWSLKQ